MSTEMGLSGPHLSGAFLCEKILQEKDGVNTFIRVVDRFTVPLLPKLPEGIQLPPGIGAPGNQFIQFNLVVMFKAGSIPGGKYHLALQLNKPDGSPLPKSVVDVFLQGDNDNGVTAVFPIMLPQPEEGLYWFDVYFEESLLTRVPLRVLHQQMQMMGLPR
jgi:hypothetical protein